MPLSLPEGSRDSGTVWPPHRCAVPPWQEAVPAGAQAEDIPLLLFPAWPLSSHGYPCASSSGQEGIMALTSCTSGCHKDWFITVRAAITEPSKGAAGRVTQSVLVTVPLLLTPVLCSWKEACGSISLCSLRCLGRAPPYCESSEAQHGEKKLNHPHASLPEEELQRLSRPHQGIKGSVLVVPPSLLCSPMWKPRGEQATPRSNSN